jgi:hypothetical protein
MCRERYSRTRIDSGVDCASAWIAGRAAGAAARSSRPLFNPDKRAVRGRIRRGTPPHWHCWPTLVIEVDGTLGVVPRLLLPAALRLPAPVISSALHLRSGASAAEPPKRERRLTAQDQPATCTPQVNFDDVLTTGAPDTQVTVMVISVLADLKVTAA